MLFRIEGTHVKLAGLAPGLASQRAELPGWLRSAVRQSERLVLDASAGGELDPALSLLPAHQSLTVLSFFGKVRELWARLEIPEHPSRFKAWAATEILRAYLSTLPAPGTAELLELEASGAEYLEGEQERFRALDAVSLDEQLARLEATATDPEGFRREERALHEAWLTLDLEAIGRTLAGTRARCPETVRRSVDERTRNWLPRMEEILRENTCGALPFKTLIAVDALHLCGDQSLLAALSREGREITRLL